MIQREIVTSFEENYKHRNIIAKMKNLLRYQYLRRDLFKKKDPNS